MRPVWYLLGFGQQTGNTGFGGGTGSTGGGLFGSGGINFSSWSLLCSIIMDYLLSGMLGESRALLGVVFKCQLDL